MTEDELVLFRRLLLQHKPVVEPDPWAVIPGMFMVHCRVCDGIERHLWQQGDPAVECEIWRENAYRIDVDED